MTAGRDASRLNQEWESPSDPDSRIARMKNGTTRLAYKAEHAVDLESEAIVAAQVTHANRGDTQTGLETLILAQTNLVVSGSSAEIAEVVKDKGYHDNRLRRVRPVGHSHLHSRAQAGVADLADKPEATRQLSEEARRRVRRAKGRRPNRWRSERCERSFAHVCETGGGRRACYAGWST
ncbi:MAG: transposase [Verrucomicrobiota bacterium]